MKPQDSRPQPRNTDRFSKAHDFDAGVDDFDAVHEMFDGLRARCPVAHSNDSTFSFEPSDLVTVVDTFC